MERCIIYLGNCCLGLNLIGMGIINNPNETGNQIMEWKLEVFSCVNQIIYLRDTLSNQLNNMTNNPDFTSEDVSEMVTLITEVNNKIEELNGG